MSRRYAFRGAGLGLNTFAACTAVCVLVIGTLILQPRVAEASKESVAGSRLLGLDGMNEDGGRRKLFRVGVTGDIATAGVGAAGVAADHSTLIRNLDSDFVHAFRAMQQEDAGIQLASIAPPEPYNAPALGERARVATDQGDEEAAEQLRQARMLAASTEALLNATNRASQGPDRTKLPTAAAELKCLTQAVYFEARGENIDGQIAVAEVIMNRVESDLWPNNVCDVISQGADQLNRCQFSFICDGKPESITDRASYQRAKDVALLVLQGERRGIAGGATHYHADYVNPSWAGHMLRTATVGTHLFYKRKRRGS